MHAVNVHLRLAGHHLSLQRTSSSGTLEPQVWSLCHAHHINISLCPTARTASAHACSAHAAASDRCFKQNTRLIQLCSGVTQVLKAVCSVCSAPQT
jgi:hypothetical protein